MEKVRIVEVKEMLKEAIEIAEPEERSFLLRIQQTIEVSPPQFLRVTKMAATIQKIISSKLVGDPNV